MNHRLTTAIEIAESATALLQRVETFHQGDIYKNKEWNVRAHMGIKPMLLALSMELALKAWYVFDHDTPKVIRSHKLPKLFAGLKPDSQHKLSSEFKRSIAPIHPDILYNNYGIENVLTQHENAFEKWRYSYEASQLRFEASVFTATLKMVLNEFNKRYYTVAVPQPRSLI